MRFIVDENLSPHMARGMREFGEQVEHLLDHFAMGTADETWLPVVGQREQILITRDDSIRWRPAQLAALRRYKVGAFFLGGKNRSRCDLIRQIVRNWPRIKERAAKEPRPFAFRIPPTGTKITRIELKK